MLKKLANLRPRLADLIAAPIARQMLRGDAVCDAVAHRVAQAMHSDDGYYGPRQLRKPLLVAVAARMAEDSATQQAIVETAVERLLCENGPDGWTNEGVIVNRLVDHWTCPGSSLGQSVIEEVAESLVGAFDEWDEVGTAVAEDLVANFDQTDDVVEKVAETLGENFDQTDEITEATLAMISERLSVTLH